MINLFFLQFLAFTSIDCVLIDLRDKCPCSVYMNIDDCGESRGRCRWINEKCSNFSEICQELQEFECKPSFTQQQCAWDGNLCINKNSTCAESTKDDCSSDFGCYFNNILEKCEEFSSCSNYKDKCLYIQGCMKKNDGSCEDFHCDQFTGQHDCTLPFNNNGKYKCSWRADKCIIIPRFDCSIITDMIECIYNYDCIYNFDSKTCLDRTKCGDDKNWLCLSLYKSEYIVQPCSQNENQTCYETLDPNTATSKKDCYDYSLRTYYWTSQGKCEKCSGQIHINSNDSENSTNNTNNSTNQSNNSTNNSSNTTTTQSTETSNNSTNQANSTTNPNNQTNSEQEQANNSINSTKPSSTSLIIQIQILIFILIII